MRNFCKFLILEELLLITFIWNQLDNLIILLSNYKFHCQNVCCNYCTTLIPWKIYHTILTASFPLARCICSLFVSLLYFFEYFIWKDQIYYEFYRLKNLQSVASHRLVKQLKYRLQFVTNSKIYSRTFSYGAFRVVNKKDRISLIVNKKNKIWLIVNKKNRICLIVTSATKW